MFHKVILMNHKKVVPKFNHFKKVLGFGVKKSISHKHEKELNSNFHKLTIRPNLSHQKNKLVIHGSSVRYDDEPKTKVFQGVPMKLVPKTKRPIRLML